MMTFLAPAALLGTLLLAVPIIVHLLKPRKMRQTPFSSLRWLKETQQRLSRRVQWHQWLLFLLRAGLIVLLVLALARPLVYLGGDEKPADRFIVVDVSRSMAYQPRGLTSSLERAQGLAEQLVTQSRPGDRTALLITDSHTRLLASLGSDTAPHLTALKSLRAGAADTNLSSALPIIRPMLQQARANSGIELYFLTDNHQQSWQQREVAAFLKDLAAPVGVHVVDVGPGSGQNAWIAGARLLPTRGEDRILRVDIGCVGEPRQEREVRLVGLKGPSDDAQQVTLTPGRLTRVDFKVPASMELAGQVAELRLEPADALPSDDRYFVNLDPAGAVRVLVIEPATPGGDGREAGIYLRAGLEALAESGNQPVELSRRTPASVTGRDIKEADLVILAGVPELADAALENLENRVRAGAGLLVFLGPEIKPDFYNNKLHKPIQPAEGLLPLPLLVEAGTILRQGNPGALTGLHWQHPVLAPFNDPILGDLGQSRFRIHVGFAGDPGKGDKVLARIDDGVPALIEHPLGKGRVLVFNTTANDDWSNLPRLKSFVPLLDRLLSYLSGGGAQRSFTVGDAVTLPIADWSPAESVTVISPSGGTIVPRLGRAGGRSFLHLSETTEPGIYQVEFSGAPEKKSHFVVNVGPGDSCLVPMDAKTLEQWWAPASFELLDFETAGRRFERRADHLILWPWLVLLAGLLLAIETYVVHRLCPRVNPKVVESVVPGRGVLMKKGIGVGG